MYDVRAGVTRCDNALIVPLHMCDKVVRAGYVIAVATLNRHGGLGDRRCGALILRVVLPRPTRIFKKSTLTSYGTPNRMASKY